MKYVPSISPPVIGIVNRWAINGTARVKPVKPVQERTLPPLVFQPQHAPPESPPTPTEKRHAEPLQEDRRTYCRRTAHKPVLEELRSHIDRRRHRQRGDDMTDHVDEKV